MPVVAVVGGERVEAWTFDAARWEHLRRTYRAVGLTMSCGQPGIPVRSPTGLLFFRHHPGSDCQLHDGGDETQEHFTAKALVADTARSLGWTATVERRSDDGTWIADVLLEHETLPRPVAVEIQWSRQSNADFHRRQDRYTAAGVDCFWIVGPVNAANIAGVPTHHMAGEARSLTIDIPATLGDKTMTSTGFTEAVTLILAQLAGAVGDRLSPHAELRATSMIIETAQVNCWNENCGRPLTRWRLAGLTTESRCGQRPDLRTKIRVTPEQEPAVAHLVLSALERSDLHRPAITDARKPGKAAPSCPYCQTIQANNSLSMVRWTPYTIPFRAQPRFRVELLRAEHRCVDIGRGHCQAPAGPGDFPSAVDLFELTASTDADAAPALPPKAARRGPERPWVTPAERKRAAARKEAFRQQAEAKAKAEREQRRKQAAAAEYVTLTSAWPNSPLRALLLDENSGVWPAHLNQHTRAGVEVPRQQWQAELWVEFIRGQAHMFPVDPRDLGAHLRRIHPDIDDPSGAISEWLGGLADAGLLSAKPRSDHPGRFFFVVNEEYARRQAEVEDERRRAREEEARRRHAEALAKQPSVQAAVLRCVFCGMKLDPIYADLSYHPVCAPGWRFGSRR